MKIIIAVWVGALLNILICTETVKLEDANAQARFAACFRKPKPKVESFCPGIVTNWAYGCYQKPDVVAISNSLSEGEELLSITGIGEGQYTDITNVVMTTQHEPVVTREEGGWIIRFLK